MLNSNRRKTINQQDRNKEKYTGFSPEMMEEAMKPFINLKKKDARRAVQTYFRSTFGVQMSLAARADRKANIMVRLHSLLISALIYFT